jgi:hypothetical protein
LSKGNGYFSQLPFFAKGEFSSLLLEPLFGKEGPGEIFEPNDAEII